MNEIILYSALNRDKQLHNDYTLINLLQKSSNAKPEIKSKSATNSIAVKLSFKLIDIILQNSNYKNNFSKFKSEYRQSIVNANIFKNEEYDLIDIYIKQTLLMLKKINNYSIFLNVAGNTENLYNNLFNSFWNLTDWSDIFPSMPDLAVELQNSRHYIAFLISNQNKKFSIEDFGNMLLDKIKLNIINPMLYYSFLDFYLFAWLKHFAIIDILPGSDKDPVEVQVTNHGRFYLRQFCKANNR